MMKIKSEKVESIYQSLANENFNQKDLNTMDNFNEFDLSELLDLIELNIIPIDILKYYFVVYNEKIILSLEKNQKIDINYYLCKCWTDCLLTESDENIISSLIGNTFFMTPLVNRVRNGFLLELDLLNKFDDKIESLIRSYHLKTQNNSLFFSLTGVDVSDEDLNTIDSDFLSIYYEIYNKIECSIFIYDYFDIFNNNFIHNDHLKKSSEKSKSIVKDNLIQELIKCSEKNIFVSFLDNEKLNFYKNINSYKNLKNKLLSKEFVDDSLGVDLDSISIESPKIVTEHKHFLKKDYETFEHEKQLKSIYNNKSFKSMKNDKNNNYYKFFIVLMCIIGLGGYVSILFSNNDARETENKAVLSIIKEEKNNNEIIKK